MKTYQRLIGLLVLLVAVPITANTVKETNLYINNTKTSVVPRFKQNNAYLPIGLLTQELGVKVEWKKPNVILKKEETTIVCTIGSSMIEKDGEKIELFLPAYIEDGRTYLPLRSISNLLGYQVKYEGETKSILIQEKIKETRVMGYIKDLKENTITFDPAEWITKQDTKRIEELKLDESLHFPNGFYVYNQTEDGTNYIVGEKTEYNIIGKGTANLIKVDLKGFKESMTKQKLYELVMDEQGNILKVFEQYLP